MPTGAQVAAADHSRVRPRLTNFLVSNRRHTSSSLYIVVIVLVVSFCVSCAQDDQSESQPLLKFKSSLENAHRIANWASNNKPPCSGNRPNWVGVLCFNGYVFGLQLENMNLKGEIDVDSLVPLRFLRTLSFMGNSFQGPMPDWRKLGALKSLYLSNNHFSGQLSEDAFRGMTSLKKVHLANNNLTGHIPASLESPKLIELRLENNQFTGSIPLISSDHLKLLNVSNNQLEGPIPAPLIKMDPTSFSGNKALCGEPLQSACPSPPPPQPVGGAAVADDHHKTNSRKIAIIVASVIAGLFLITVLLLVVVAYRRRCRRQTPQLGRAVSPADIEEANYNNNNVAVDDMNGSSRKGKSEQQQDQASLAPAGKLSFVSEERQKFELQDLMRASAEVLGSGNFGASYKAVLVDGEALVVKRFKQMNTIAKEDFHEHMRRLGRLKHPNLLPLVAYLYRKEEKLLVFEYAHNGSLAAQLHGNHQQHGPLSWATRLKIIKGVGKGLVYLQHELPSLTLPHGHLKSSNVLLDKDFNPMLMDYALAPVVNSAQVHQTLLAYKSPEYAKHGLISKKTDVWCFGVLILETVTGKYDAHGGSQAELAGYINAIAGVEISAQVFDKDIVLESKSQSEMEKLLQIGIACCHEDPDKRWDLNETLHQIDQIQESSSPPIIN